MNNYILTFPIQGGSSSIIHIDNSLRNTTTSIAIVCFCSSSTSDIPDARESGQKFSPLKYMYIYIYEKCVHLGQIDSLRTISQSAAFLGQIF